MHGHELLDGPIELKGDKLKQWKAVVLNPTSYHLQPAAVVRQCSFEPCLLLRAGNIDMMISFACMRMRVLRNGEMISMTDIQPGYNDILGLAKRIFPDDIYIQLFDEERAL